MDRKLDDKLDPKAKGKKAPQADGKAPGPGAKQPHPPRG